MGAVVQGKGASAGLVGRGPQSLSTLGEGPGPGRSVGPSEELGALICMSAFSRAVDSGVLEILLAAERPTGRN